MAISTTVSTSGTVMYRPPAVSATPSLLTSIVSTGSHLQQEAYPLCTYGGSHAALCHKACLVLRILIKFRIYWYGIDNYVTVSCRLYLSDNVALFYRGFVCNFNWIMILYSV